MLLKFSDISTNVCILAALSSFQRFDAFIFQPFNAYEAFPSCHKHFHNFFVFTGPYIKLTPPFRRK